MSLITDIENERIAQWRTESGRSSVITDSYIERWIRQAHEVSTNNGFWGEGRANVGEKLALVHTEVVEFMDEVPTEGAPSQEELVELADICLRVFDLAGYLGFKLFPITEATFYAEAEWPETDDELVAAEYLETVLHRCIGRATQSHRKGFPGAMEVQLGKAVAHCFVYADHVWGQDEALSHAIDAKMQKNAGRAYMHGARY